MKWWFNKKEKRENEQPHTDITQSACDEVNQGIGLIQKLLNLKGYEALSQSAFFAAVNLISNSVAEMSWEVKSKENEEIPDKFYANHIFDNALLSQFILTKQLILDVLLHGNGFAYIERDKKGMPINLVYLPWGQCNIVYNKINGSLFYQAPIVSNSLIEPINMIHLRIHSVDGIIGKPITAFAKNAITLSGSADKAAQEFFSSGMTVKGILSTEAPRLTKDQRESIRSAWNESQVGNGAGIAVLESGMKFNAISSNSKDSELLETRLFNVQEIARFFNISPVLLGDLSKSSYNSIEQAMIQFTVNCLAPYVMNLEQELNKKLILPSDQSKYYIDICEEDIIKTDKSAQVTYLSTLVDKGIISRNEARKQLGFGPVDGGDELTVSYSDPSQNNINKDKNTQEQNNDEEES
jgi:HK97 family phage portal protein